MGNLTTSRADTKIRKALSVSLSGYRSLHILLAFLLNVKNLEMLNVKFKIWHFWAQRKWHICAFYCGLCTILFCLNQREVPQIVFVSPQLTYIWDTVIHILRYIWDTEIYTEIYLRLIVVKDDSCTPHYGVHIFVIVASLRASPGHYWPYWSIVTSL